MKTYLSPHFSIQGQTRLSREQPHPTELSAVMEMFCIALSSTLANSHMWLLGTWNVASVTEELKCWSDLTAADFSQIAMDA